MTKIILNGDETEITVSTAFELGASGYPDHDIVILNGVQLIEDAPLNEGDILFFGKSPDNDGNLSSAITKRCDRRLSEPLAHATVGIAGCGGLGSNIATYLARSGIRKLIIADFDRVEFSNLNRQNYSLKHLGFHKVDATKEVLSAINPNVDIEVHRVTLDENNIPEIFGGCDIICEAFDVPDAKAMILSTVAEKLPDIPLVCGSGMAGFGDTDAMTVRQVGENIFICGDGVSGISDDRGIMAPRVAVCAGIMANKVLQLLASKEA